jgi:pSer/pThr/pTyr-binding forkhead associated (FHA) protein
VTLNGEPIQKHRLRPGDTLTIGAIGLQVLIAPPPRRHTAIWEQAVWILLGVVAALQVVIAWRVLDL